MNTPPTLRLEMAGRLTRIEATRAWSAAHQPTSAHARGSKRVEETSNGGHDPALLELAWALLVREWDTLKKMCQISARKSRGRDTWEEAMSLVAAKLPQTLESWDPAGGRSLNSYVIANARWHLYKEFVWKRREREAGVASSCSGEDLERRSRERVRSHDPALAARRSDVADDDRSGAEREEEVRYLLEAVGEAEALVLRLHFMEGLTCAEVGEALGCSKSMAYRMVTRALELAREAGSRMR